MTTERLSQAVTRDVRAVAIGGSAGGLQALAVVLRQLPRGYPLPILVAHHIHRTDGGSFVGYVRGLTTMPVVEAEDKMPVAPGTLYTAPANHHLLVERDGTLALSVEEKVNWSRPSIDVLFESAARAYGDKLAAVLLSGANQDGAWGLKDVALYGGLTLVQDPLTAVAEAMPRAAIDCGAARMVLSPLGIGSCLSLLGSKMHASCPGGKPCLSAL